MSKFLKRDFRAAYIMLGNSCNMNCKYCLQHSLVHNSIDTEINPDVIDFLCELAYERKPEKFPIVFFGGEPLLYFNAIKKLTEILSAKYYLNFDFRIITNGKAITAEIVKFFNRYKFRVVVSYDGCNTVATRNYDIFQNEKRKTDILAIDDLCLSGVVSAYTYPSEILSSFQKLSDEYFLIHGYHLGVNLDTVFDTGLPNRDLLQFDYKRLTREVKSIINQVHFEAVNGIYNPEHACQNNFVFNEVSKCARLQELEKDEWFNTCRCTNGINIINIDLEGKLYGCHNTSTNIGSIYDSYPTYIEKVLNNDNAKEIKNKCSQCNARYWCWSCKMVDNEHKEGAVCKVKKAFYKPFYEYITTGGANIC